MTRAAAPPAVVLAGGLGTRLRRVVGDRPKSLAPVAGYPFLHRLLARLADAGVRDVVLAVGHGAEPISEACGDGAGFGLRVRYALEREPLGTAGALKHAAAALDRGPFLALNGDSFVDSPLDGLIERHRERRARISMLVTPARDRGRFGSVALADDGGVRRFGEKADEGAGLVNAGVYLVEPDVAASIPDGRAVSLEDEVLPRLAGAGLYGVPVDGPLVDIGTRESYAAAQSFFLARRTSGEALLRRASMRRGIVLLDRDGTINREVEYLSDPDGMEPLPGAAAAIRRLHDLELTVVVVTNQSAVGRGRLEPATLERIHERMLELLAAEAATVAGIYVCPHSPDAGCDCRKPRTGMLERALREFGFDAEDAYMVGDNRTDVEAGGAVGATTILVRTGHGRKLEADAAAAADAVADDLGAAVDEIERRALAPAAR